MLAEYYASPHARVLSLPLETNSTIFETSYFSVGQENLQNNKHEYRDFQTILEHIKNIINSENRKGMLSDIKTEFEHIIQSTDINVLHDYLHSVYNNYSKVWFEEGELCLFSLIVYHVLVASENENSTEILNSIKDKLIKLQECDVNLYLYCIFQLYLDVYYKDNPNDIFTNIHSIWKCAKATELNMKLVYCKNLIEAKDYKTLIQLIHDHADNLIESFEENEHELCNRSTAIMVLLHVLHYQVSLNKMERVKTITTILSRLSMSIMRYDKHDLLNGFPDFLLTLDNKQLLCTPYVIKLLHSLMKEQPLDYLRIILVCSNRLSQANHYTERIKFIKCHFKLISSVPTNMLKTQGCYYTQQYCISLLLLLNEFISCHDTHNINLVLTKLLELRVSFLSDESSYTCYCFMGNQECSTKQEEKLEKDSSFYRAPSHKTEFKKILLKNYHERRLLNTFRTCSMKRRKYMYSPFTSSPTGSVYELKYFILVMNKVIQGELELAPYLRSIINIMSKTMYKDESVSFFIEFIGRSADKNEESLYNIVKTLWAFDLQPEIQDLILQGVTAYLMISCNRQYGILSKFILAINMICPKDQFLHKLTLGISKSLLKFDNDTVKDFNNLIFKCYCTVRHDCRNKKDANITKYKEHYSFIAPMEVKEVNMKKLTALTNFFLMLTLLLIASGGHHKSAELKKYLSLKYEYRDSILYLLWCSGDVEINPGPTLRTIRKVPDSVKERNWIYEMCSMLLRLLKYKSIEIRIDGLWKEKPLDWPVDSPFYDPRNKPKGKRYSIKTDRKLLNNLEELCNGKGFFEEVTQFDDEYTKSTVKQYQKEITTWRTNKADLFELYILRQELDILLEAKTSLQKYKKEPDLKEGLGILNVDLIFDSEEDMCLSNAGYTNIVRDIAITLCRIGKGLPPLEKSDGIWKTPPSGWCLTDEYFSPCNAGKRPGKCKDPCKRQGNCKERKLVDNLLRCCETMVQEYCKVNEKPVLIKLLHAWKLKNVKEVRKYHTIWSNMEVIDHSLKYLKIEGLLAKSQTHIEKLGIKPRATDSKESIQDSIDLSSRPIQGRQTNLKCPTIIQSHQDNHFDTTSKLRDSDSSQKIVPLPLMGRKYQETDQTTQNNTNKRKHQSTDENYSVPKKLHKSDKGKPLLLQVLTSSSEYGKNEANTSPKGHSHDCKIVSIKSRPNFPALEKQTDQLVINTLPDTSDGEPVDSSSCKQADNVNKKGETTLDQCVNQIVNLLEEIEQDYSPTVVEPSIQDSSSTTDQSSEVCNELPEYVQLYIDTVENSYNPDDTLNIDIEQFIEEQNMDLS